MCVLGSADFGIDPLAREDRTHLQGAIGLHRRLGVSRGARRSPLLRPAPELEAPALPFARWLIGYLVAQTGRLLAVNEAPESAAWVHGTQLRAAALGRLLPKLAQLCEGASASSSGNWQIFDWATTLQGARLRWCR